MQNSFRAGTFPEYDGGPNVALTVTVALECKATPAPHLTIDHEPCPELLGLSVTANGMVGSRWVCGGQCRDALRSVIEEGKPDRDRNQLRQLLEIWERWHLNGLNASCAHQDKDVAQRTDHYRGGAEYGTPEYRAIMQEQRDKCPEGYSWGSAWLAEELPAEVVAFVESL